VLYERREISDFPLFAIGFNLPELFNGQQHLPALSIASE
jgi:hypothetical protein